MGVTPEEFRVAMSQWASGVAVVTSRAGGRVHGMTVSAFNAVSLEPPLVLVCADKASDTQSVIAEAGVFAVNVLARGQAALSQRFASKQYEERRFEGLEVETAETGAPLIPGALAALDCRVVAAHDAGDHVIYVGRVEFLRAGEGEPLLYFGGAYRVLGGGGR
ncbi:MAG: flavin reductase family protein [Myxococcota bacterium]